MDNFSFNDPLIFARRKGTSDDPFIDVAESLILDSNAKATLTEIPSDWHGITVEGEGQTWFEIREGIPKENEYLIEYDRQVIRKNDNFVTLLTKK